MKKDLPIIIGLILIVACIYRVPNSIMRASMELSAVVGISLILAIWLADRVNIWLGLFVFLAVFSHVYPVYNAAGYKTLHNILIASGLLLFMSYKPEYFEHVFDVLLIVAMVNLIVIGFDLLNIHVPYRMFWGSDCEGITANRNESAAIFAFALPAALLRGKTRAWMILPIAIGLILTRTSGAVLSVMAGLFVFWRLKGYRHLFLFMLAGVLSLILYLVFVDTTNASSRWIMWGGVLEAIKLKLWLGWGIGQYPNIYNHSPHNEFLRLLMEMGLASIFIVYGYICSCVLDFWGEVEISDNQILCITALIIIAANSFISFQLHIGVTALMALLWLGKFEEARRDNS